MIGMGYVESGRPAMLGYESFGIKQCSLVSSFTSTDEEYQVTLVAPSNYRGPIEMITDNSVKSAVVSRSDTMSCSPRGQAHRN